MLKSFEFYYNNIKTKFNYKLTIEEYEKMNKIKVIYHVDDYLNVNCSPHCYYCFLCYDCFLCYECYKCEKCEKCINCNSKQNLSRYVNNDMKIDFYYRIDYYINLLNKNNVRGLKFDNKLNCGCKNCVDCYGCINCKYCKGCDLCVNCYGCINCIDSNNCIYCDDIEKCENCINCASHIHDDNDCNICEIYWSIEELKRIPHKMLFNRENLNNIVLYKSVDDLPEIYVESYNEIKFNGNTELIDYLQLIDL